MRGNRTTKWRRGKKETSWARQGKKVKEKYYSDQKSDLRGAKEEKDEKKEQFLISHRKVRAFNRAENNTFFLFWKDPNPPFQKKEKDIVFGAVESSNFLVCLLGRMCKHWIIFRHEQDWHCTWDLLSRSPQMSVEFDLLSSQSM